MADVDADIPTNIDIINSKMTYFEKVVEEIIANFERGEAQPYDQMTRSIWAELAELEVVMSNTQTDRMAKITLKLSTEAQKHAEAGKANAQYTFGRCYLYGYGVEKDSEQAVKWVRMAADQNLAYAQQILGDCYLNGKGVEKDDVVAVNWYRKAAEQGHAIAQHNLGFCYAQGEGVSEDDAEAVKWYRMAADQNLAHAQNNLGYSYLNGEGVKKDAEQAVKWLRMAANQNVTNALYGLGYCYDKGDGVSQDPAEATKWYSKAAKAGHIEAQSRLKVMKMPVVVYEPSKHGPKIKGFFIGMSVREFDEAAAKILRELGVDAPREETQESDTISVYYKDLDSQWGVSKLDAKFSRSGNLTELKIRRS